VNTRPKLLCFALTVLLCTVGLAEAQQPKKTPRIGYLQAPPLSVVAVRTNAFRQALHDLGYIEGKNVILELRSADGKIERVPAIIAELIHLNVDIIVSGGSVVTQSAKKATKTIPIVMAQEADPVGSGLIASLARPGGNITGLATLAPELSGKQLELLKEIVPTLARVAVLESPGNSGNAPSLRETERAGQAFDVKIQRIDITHNDIESAFQMATNARADAILVLSSPFATSQRKKITTLAAQNRLPAVSDRVEFVEDGGLMTYSVSSTDLFRRAAIYVDKILKGSTPADLPVEQPTKFELVINLKTAKQIGLTVPPNFLARADRVIK
jgi:putative tryptophan/tyrosine transport system substrate-binding protein